MNLKNNKNYIINVIAILMAGYTVFELIQNFLKGNMEICALILTLIAIVIGAVLLSFRNKHAGIVFSVANILILTVLVCYLFFLKDTISEGVWVWFFVVPPFAAYVCNMWESFVDMAYGQLLLIMVLWTPLSKQIHIPQQQYLSWIPLVYFTISAFCFAISGLINWYQIEQQETSRRMNAQMETVNERRRIDRMTELWNRDYVEEPISSILEKKCPCAFFLMDIDNFKMINDLLGHQAGDQALHEFACVMKSVFEPETILARFGGDEFVAFVPDYTSIDALRKLAGGMLEGASTIVDDERISDKIGVSIGISLSPEAGTSFDELYSNADKAQYFAKRKGKNRYSFYARSQEQVMRDSEGADIKTLQRMVQNVWFEEGAYTVGYAGFNSVYQFLERNLSRTKQEIQILLFTIVNQESHALKDDILEKQYEILGESVKYSLRSGDLMMNFSRNQVAALLVNCGSEDGKQVAERILDAYRKKGFWEDATVTYEIGSVDKSGAKPGKGEDA